MGPDELLDFKYHFEAQGAGERTLLLLHGTGADENDLLPLGRALDPDANLLSPRGKVLENGLPRFFRRFAEGVLDVEDLKERTHELVEFIEAAAKKHDIDISRVTAVGNSNGANIAASTLLLHPNVLSAAVLFRPMFPYEPESRPDLQGVGVLIGSARNDELVHPADPDRLAGLLKDAGAEVELFWGPGGHALGNDDVRAAAEWLRRRP